MVPLINDAGATLRWFIEDVWGLRVLNTALEPFHTSAGVAELRDRLASTAA